MAAMAAASAGFRATIRVEATASESDSRAVMGGGPDL
jgi:hypothetical protein